MWASSRPTWLDLKSPRIQASGQPLPSVLSRRMASAQLPESPSVIWGSWLFRLLTPPRLLADLKGIQITHHDSSVSRLRTLKQEKSPSMCTSQYCGLRTQMYEKQSVSWAPAFISPCCLTVDARDSCFTLQPPPLWLPHHKGVCIFKPSHSEPCPVLSCPAQGLLVPHWPGKYHKPRALRQLLKMKGELVVPSGSTAFPPPTPQRLPTGVCLPGSTNSQQRHLEDEVFNTCALEATATKHRV